MKRVFILGAGFSKAAGMPMASELLPLLTKRLQLHEMNGWLRSLQERLQWLSESENGSSYQVNIEQVFHYAHFDAEIHRLLQHLEPVGRHDGSGTAWNQVDAISAWLSYLERELCDVIHNAEDTADHAPINRWAETVSMGDTVLTFNYDTLVERSLSSVDKEWNHATGLSSDSGFAVCKLHGSIDWIVAHRIESFSKLDLIFDKENSNRGEQNTGFVEDDYRLWRCHAGEQLQNWISGRDLQSVPEGARPKRVGIAGLGSYKPLHEIPGLGPVWVTGMRALRKSDSAIIVGFSMSDFDAMAQMQFAQVAKARQEEKNPLHVKVIDPHMNEGLKARFQRVFRHVDFIESNHEEVDWSRY